VVSLHDIGQFRQLLQVAAHARFIDFDAALGAQPERQLGICCAGAAHRDEFGAVGHEARFAQVRRRRVSARRARTAARAAAGSKEEAVFAGI